MTKDVAYDVYLCLHYVSLQKKRDHYRMKYKENLGKFRFKTKGALGENEEKQQ